MNVSQLAKEYGVTSQEILQELKSLKLKAKDGKQEISSAVLAVLRSSLLKKGKKIVNKVDVTSKPVKEKEKTVKSIVKKPEKIVKPIAKKSEKEKKPIKTVLKKTVVKKEKVSAKKSPSKKLEKTKKKTLEANKTAVISETKEESKIIQGPPSAENVQEKQSESSVKVDSRIKAEPGIFKQRFFKKKPHKDIKDKVQIEPKIPAKSEPSVVLGPAREVEIDIPISVKDLSVKLQQKPSIVLKALMKRGIFATINQSLEEPVVEKMAEDLNFTFRKVKTQEEKLMAFHDQKQDDPSKMKQRFPVVTFMGHVDHGKTSLLDKIRESNVVDKEHGGITQHMAAYSVKTPRGMITFLDTPGHAAFTAMRARGAHITDLVVLVVAADEGVMPQTEEAIDHAKAGEVPIVVAVNKIDKKNADLDRVKKQLADRGLVSEKWGGKTVVVGVSAVTGQGIDELLEMILLEAEMLELKANYDKAAFGIVVEAHLSHGKGPVASVIVQEGTLREGDTIVAGPYFGKIKAMFDDQHRLLSKALPSTPAEILGLSGVPEAGEIFYVVSDERQAKEIASKRTEQLKNKKLQSSQKITLEDLYSQIQEGKVKELSIIVKADVQGSLEALKDSLAQLSTDEVKIKFLHTAIGDINAADVILAGVSNAIIVGFHVDLAVKAKEELEKQNVDVRTYRIIYDAVSDIKNALSGLLEPKMKKVVLGQVEIRQVFKLSKSGVVAGCFVRKGRVHRKAKISIVRNGGEIFSGEIDSLKRFKDDVKEVREGFECGITMRGYDAIQPGDIMEVYEFEKIQRTL